MKDLPATRISRESEGRQLVHLAVWCPFEGVGRRFDRARGSSSVQEHRLVENVCDLRLVVLAVVKLIDVDGLLSARDCVGGNNRVLALL